MKQKEGGENGKHIKSAHTVFDIIEFIKQNEGSTVSELTDELKYSKSTIYYYLQTLESRRYVVNEQGTYYLSLRFFDLGDHAISRHQPPSLVENEVDKLSEKTGQTAFFAVEESGKGMYVYQTDPQVLSQGDQTGIEHYLHASASGKAILARLSETEVSNIIEQHGLPAVTDETITDADELQSELEDVREFTVAFENGERLPGVGAIAAPIVGDSGNVLGAVGIAGDADEFEKPAKNLKNKSWKAQRFTDKPWNTVRQTAQFIHRNFQDEVV